MTYVNRNNGQQTTTEKGAARKFPTRDALDAITIQTISELCVFGYNMPGIKRILELDCPKRIGAIVRAARRDCEEATVAHSVRNVRPVTSLDWFIGNPQRLLRSYIVIRMYLIAKDAMRESGVIQRRGLMKARLIIETFRNYLDMYRFEPSSSDFSLPRIGNLVDFYERGSLVMRTCRECRREHLTDRNHIHSGVCPSCTRINTSFCACGRSVNRDARGRRPDARVQCPSCVDIATNIK